MDVKLFVCTKLLKHNPLLKLGLVLNRVTRVIYKIYSK